MNFKYENDEIVWEIDGDLLDRMKHAEFKNRFNSPRFNAINTEWYFKMYPNGRETKGLARLDICSSKETMFCYYIEMTETNFCQKSMNGNSIKKGEYLTLKSPYLFEQIQTLSKLTVYIRIWKPSGIL
eukprot:120628_1